MGALDYLPYYTYEDYVNWKGEWELIYGIAYAMSPAPMLKHQSISSKIARNLEDIFEDCSKCRSYLPIDWKASDDTVVQPDNLVVCEKPTNKAYITKAPKIIFEILSKSTAKKDLHVKYDLYEKEGVNYYIIVDPDEELANVYKLDNGRYAKLCDATDEKVVFELKECKEKLEFDFSKIW